MTTLQAITYRGRTVAAASPTRFFLSDQLARLPGPRAPTGPSPPRRRAR